MLAVQAEYPFCKQVRFNADNQTFIMGSKMKRINLKFPQLVSLAAVAGILISSCGVQMPQIEQTSQPSAVPQSETKTETKSESDSKTDSSNYEKNIIGEWYGEMTYESGSTSVVLKSTDEYFKNNKSNSSFEISVSEDGVTINYAGTATGEWAINDDKLITTIVDLKSSITSISQGGITMTPEAAYQEGIDLGAFPKLEDLIPQGTTESQEIVSITDSKLKLKIEIEEGKEPILVTSRKQ